jgi:hypothetical protein
MTNIAYELGNQVQEELHTSDEINLISYDSLLIMGMGGSGVSGDVLKLLSNLAYLFLILGTQKRPFQD